MSRWNITAPLGCSFEGGKDIVEMNDEELRKYAIELFCGLCVTDLKTASVEEVVESLKEEGFEIRRIN